MTQFTDQQRAANCMGSFAHLLGGRPGRHAEFIRKVELILGGVEPDAWRLMQFASHVRLTKRPVIWAHYSADSPGLPQIGLVALDRGQIHILESCVLWMAPSGDRARLIPDRFDMGSFLFDDDLTLRRLKKAPVKGIEHAGPGMTRAYSRLVELQKEQFERGEVFELPELHKAA